MWPTDTSYPHRSKYTTYSMLISSPCIRRWRNMGKHTRGHPRSLCRVKRSTKWSRSCRQDVKNQVTHSNTRFTGKATLRPTIHGYPTRTYTCQISLKNSTPKEGRSKQLKGDENGYVNLSVPSHVFSQQQLQQLPLLQPTPSPQQNDHAPLSRQKHPSTNTMDGGTYC
jgi:hypothetical protein